MTHPSGHLAIKDIASLAGVTRAAVSNWRSRNEDFPAPVEGSPERRPLFDLHDIMSWLKQKELLPEDAQKKQTEIGIWAVANLLRSAASEPTDVSILILYLLALRKQSEQDSSNPSWSRVVESSTVDDFTSVLADAAAPKGTDFLAVSEVVEKMRHTLHDSMVAEIVTSLNNIPIKDYGEAAATVIDRLLGLGGRGDISALSTSNSPQSALLINAATTTLTSGSTVFDPACGIGGTLLGLHDKQSELRLVGNDINNTVITMARLHTYLAGISATFTQSDSLTSAIHCDGRADTIVTEPPLGMRFDREVQLNVLAKAGMEATGSLLSDELFLFVALSNLASGGHAYVLTTTRAGVSASSKQVRQELVARGLIEAVIKLPPRLLPYSNIETLLWVLHRPEGKTETSVLVADATSVTSPEKDIAQWLTDMRQGHDTTIPARRISLAELITNEGAINPPALLREELDGDRVREELNHCLTAVLNTVTEIQNIDFDGDNLHLIPSSTGFTDLKQLIDSNAVTRIRKPFLNRENKAPDNGMGAFVLPLRDNGQELKTVTATEAEVWVENGDILVPDLAPAPARIFTSDDNRWVVPLGISVLRVNDPNLDPDYLIACINAPFNEAARQGVAIQHRDFKQIQIPDLDHDQQKQLCVSLKKLSMMKQDAERLSQQAEAAEAAILNAVRFHNNTTL